MACHRSAELVGDENWRRQRNVNSLLKSFLKTKGSHIYRWSMEVDVTRFLKTVSAKAKSDFWGKEYCWALDHSKSHAGPGKSSFSHIIPSPVPCPCRQPQHWEAGGLQGMLVPAEAVSTCGASPAAEHALDISGDGTRTSLDISGAVDALLDFPISSFLISLSPREKSPRDHLFSLLFFFSLRCSLLPKEAHEGSHTSVKDGLVLSLKEVLRPVPNALKKTEKRAYW